LVLLHRDELALENDAKKIVPTGDAGGDDQVRVGPRYPLLDNWEPVIAAPSAVALLASKASLAMRVIGPCGVVRAWVWVEVPFEVTACALHEQLFTLSERLPVGDMAALDRGQKLEDLAVVTVGPLARDRIAITLQWLPAPRRA
jgi:hypothetical protein